MAKKPQRVRMEPNPKWIRGTQRGQTVVNSTSARLVWEIPYYPAWYFPIEDVHADLKPSGETFRSPSRGVGTRYDLVLGGPGNGDKGDEAVLANAAWRHLDSPVEELRNLVRIEWGALDAWFEEESEVFVHPRSPETRVDALASSRRVRVLLDGEVLADSSRPTLLFETGLPTRYYLPKSDVRMELLTPADSVTACPYKGWASYWNITVNGEVHRDLAWGYRSPLPESAPIAGHVCFYNEKVDLEVDGIALEQPKTKFS